MKTPQSLILSSAIILIIACLEIANGAKILFFVGLASHSHRVAVQPLATALAERGHEITFISPIKPEVPNPKIKEYCPKILQDINDEAVKSTGDASGRLKDRHYDYYNGNNLWDVLYQLVESTLNDSEFMTWLNNAQFDLIIHDHPGKEFIYAFAFHTKAKVIAFCSGGAQVPSDFDTFGFPIESWYDGMYANPYWYIPDRVYNAFHTILRHLAYRDYYMSRVESLAREKIQFDFPPLMELIQKTDLYLSNDHFSSSYARPLPTNVIAVGGMHAKDSNGSLPKDIEDFLADADQFLFLSFGSIIKVASLPVEVQKYFFDAVAAFPKTKFLWKWEGEVPNNLPSNALAKKWFPQQDVLAHPKCKGFMTQGGQMSVQQAIYNGVPVIIVPVFADQPYNARAAEHLKIGIHLELVDINKETLQAAFGNLLNNKMYAESAKAVSRRFKDRPLSAVETAVWWTEYVLRHDTEHLRSEGTYLSWIQRRFLDIWGATLFLVTLSLVIIGLTFKKLYSLCVSISSDKRKLA